MSTKLLTVMQRAKRDPQMRFTTLAHLLDQQMLRSVYESLRKDAAVGVDGMSYEAYGQELDANLRDLHERMRSKRYRHQPIRRVHIPKGRGKTRPIGVSTMEDKVVQGALKRVLEALYEPLFLECSYGFRPGRSAHDAIRDLNSTLLRAHGGWILEADIQSFFDSIDRKMLMEMLRERIADPSFLRLVGKCLHVGILDGEDYSEPDEGTVQGSVLSPLLGNVYLHHVLDLWFEQNVLPRLGGRARLFRYADDFVICFEREDDARRVMKALGARFGRFGLKLHPEKTRLIPFQRPSRGQRDGKGPGTFDFLGFTVLWYRNRKGSWTPRFKTRKASLSKFVKNFADWCRRHRHRPVKQQHATLARKLHGHFNYFGVNGNISSLRSVATQAKKLWRKWLNRRSQRASKTWKRFDRLQRDFPLPVPSIRVDIWSA